MKKLLKMLGIHVHTWGKWEIARVTVYHTWRVASSIHAITAQRYVQVRLCKTCGLRQTRRLKIEED